VSYFYNQTAYVVVASLEASAYGGGFILILGGMTHE